MYSDRSHIIARLILKGLAGKLSVQEKKELDGWLSESEQHLDYYNRLTDDEGFLEEMIFINDVMTDNMQTANLEIQQHPALQHFKETRVYQWPIYRKMLLAASVTIAAVLLWLDYNPMANTSTNMPIIYAVNNENKDPELPSRNTGHNKAAHTKVKHDPGSDYDRTIQTEKGRQDSIVLPDGSKVWLNEASVLKYPTQFTGNERRVELIGEAYFEVAKMKGKPFFVIVPLSNTRDKTAKVEALGTSFNVNSYTENNDKKITLLEGRIKISAAPSSHEQANCKILIPGQQAQLTNNGDITIVPVNNLQDAVLWKKGGFYLKNATSFEAVRQLQNYFNVTINEEELKWLPDCRYNINVHKKNITSVLALMSKECHEFRYEYNDKNNQLKILPFN